MPYDEDDGPVALADRDSPGTAALARLHGAHKHLMETIAILEKRVAPVLLPDHPHPQVGLSEKESDAPAPRSEYVASLERGLENIERECMRLSLISDRIDI